mmetsp:Transcript_1399/g.2281  ORF Transcript_1399/g.2281 Transcript_1399/m.2281 type:complete len:337 (-) Transcript_1399:69-1079(-)
MCSMVYLLLVAFLLFCSTWEVGGFAMYSMINSSQYFLRSLGRQVQPLVGFVSQLRMINSGSSSDSDKTIIFIRHGTTEMNEQMKKMPWFSRNFVDAGLWDTRLSESGKEHAKAVHDQLIEEKSYCFDQVEVLIASPLTRTLQTAEIVLSHREDLLPSGIPRVSHPLLRERLYLSSEVGRSKHELSKEFPNWIFSDLPEDLEEAWWYTHPDADLRTEQDLYVSTTRRVRRSKSGVEIGTDIDYVREFISDVQGKTPPEPYVEWRPPGKYCVEGEPRHVFQERMIQLRQYLRTRPESCIAVVAHWGVLKALTGYEFSNCEIKEMKFSELLDDPKLDKY